MRGWLNNLFMFVIVFMLCVVMGPGYARAAAPQAPVQQDANGLAQSGFMPTADFIGNADTCRIGASTPTWTTVVCATGSGIVYAVDNSSGTAGDVAVLSDASALPAATAVGFATEGINISPLILSGGASATGCTVPGTCETWNPARPRRFGTKLLFRRRGTSNAEVHFRLDSTNAVTPPTK
jgi:hypothetical protein